MVALALVEVCNSYGLFFQGCCFQASWIFWCLQDLVRCWVICNLNRKLSDTCDLWNTLAFWVETRCDGAFFFFFFFNAKTN